MSVKTTKFSELEFAALAPIKFCDDCSFFIFRLQKKTVAKLRWITIFLKRFWNYGGKEDNVLMCFK